MFPLKLLLSLKVTAFHSQNIYTPNYLLQDTGSAVGPMGGNWTAGSPVWRPEGPDWNMDALPVLPILPVRMFIFCSV